jgi:hypothetical protein
MLQQKYAACRVAVNLLVDDTLHPRQAAKQMVTDSCKLCIFAQVAAGRAAELRATIAPFFLRREKGSVQRVRARCGLGFRVGPIAPVSATPHHFNQDVAVELMQLCHGQLECSVVLKAEVLLLLTGLQAQLQTRLCQR